MFCWHCIQMSLQACSLVVQEDVLYPSLANEYLVALQDVHGDVKPENFLLGPPDSPSSQQAVLC